jgi:HSP20 family protein
MYYGFHLSMEVGSRKEEVSVELLPGNVLQISGNNNMKDEGMAGRWHLLERAHGKFLRKFQLPPGIEVGEMQARDKNGVIIITIPKKPLLRTVFISDIPSYALS